MAENALTRLPLTGQLGVGAGAAAVIAGLFYWFAWAPMVEEETQKQTKLDGLLQDIRALEVTASKLEDFKREVAQLEQKLETLKRILPPEKETPDLMKKIQYLAQQSNLQIRQFTPSATVKKEFYEEWPISMIVEGSYHNLGLFFDRVSRLPRLVNVGNLNITPLGSQTLSRTITAACTATTFVYIDKPPAAAAPPPVKK
jgi:type IV pilus assembly protein PilO